MQVSTATRIMSLALLAMALDGCNSETQSRGIRAPKAAQAKESNSSPEFKILGLRIAPATGSDSATNGYKPIGTEDALHVVLSVDGKPPSTLKSRLIRLQDGSDAATANVPVSDKATRISFTLDAPGNWVPGHYLLEVSGGRQVVHRELTIRDASRR